MEKIEIDYGISESYLSSCRICLKSTDVARSILEIYADSTCYADIFLTCTGINVRDKPEVPSLICDSCDKSLLDFFNFRNQCIESNDFLCNSFVAKEENEIEILFEIEKDEFKPDDESDDFKPADDGSNVDVSSEEYSSEEEEEVKPKKVKSQKRKNPVPRVCEICGKQIVNGLKAYESHLLSHDPSRPKLYDCKYCDRKFRVKKSLIQHQNIHENKKPYNCQYCEETFFNNQAKLHHERRIHTFHKPYKCEPCDKSFYTKNEINVHTKRKHTRLLNIICDICNKGFISTNDLKAHRPIHDERRPFQCDVCGKAYPRKSSLHVHSKIHQVNKKIITCPICNAIFYQIQVFRNHVTTSHPTDRKTMASLTQDLTCYVCDTSFPDGPAFKRHLNIHSNRKKKEFPCPTCSECFLKNSALRRHRVKSHPKDELPESSVRLD